jgi:hypothetical protein
VALPLMTPTPPPYDALSWEKKPFAEKVRMVCQAWALQGYGSPIGAILIYAVKVLAYLWAWTAFVRFTPGLGEVSEFGRWWSEPVAFQKAILWSLLFEISGLGCGSGPLTGRYFPPIGGVLYFWRPGTTKRPLFPELPLVGGHRRTILDVALYVGLQVALLWALTRPAITGAELWPVVILLPISSRPTGSPAPRRCSSRCGSGPASPSSTTTSRGGRGDDQQQPGHPLRAGCAAGCTAATPTISAVAAGAGMAHAGTALELAVPLVLGSPTAGPARRRPGADAVLHTFITSSVPMGVPLEWNVMVVYGGFALFWRHPERRVVRRRPPARRVPGRSRSSACRSSATCGRTRSRSCWRCATTRATGPTACGCSAATATASSIGSPSPPWIHDQLARFYDPRTAVGLVGKVIGFRLMHLHGRALPTLLPKAVDAPTSRTTSGSTASWSRASRSAGTSATATSTTRACCAAIQAQCGFEPGELRCVFVEAQPLERERGELEVADLRQRQPWPT